VRETRCSSVTLIRPSYDAKTDMLTVTAPEVLRPTNLGFGRGADASSLYVTNLYQWRLLRIKTVRRGHYFD
jgi:hypothetical protein